MKSVSSQEAKKEKRQACVAVVFAARTHTHSQKDRHESMLLSNSSGQVVQIHAGFFRRGASTSRSFKVSRSFNVLRSFKVSRRERTWHMPMLSHYFNYNLYIHFYLQCNHSIWQTTEIAGKNNDYLVLLTYLSLSLSLSLSWGSENKGPGQWRWVRIETRGIFTPPMIAASQANTSDGYVNISLDRGKDSEERERDWMKEQRNKQMKE